MSPKTEDDAKVLEGPFANTDIHVLLVGENIHVSLIGDDERSVPPWIMMFPRVH